MGARPLHVYYPPASLYERVNLVAEMLEDAAIELNDLESEASDRADDVTTVARGNACSSVAVICNYFDDSLLRDLVGALRRVNARCKRSLKAVS
jgi:hypothetical protein